MVDDWWASLDAPVGRSAEQFAPRAPEPQAVFAPQPSSGGPSGSPVGRYADIDALPIGNDVRNQLFAQLGMGDFGWSEMAEGQNNQTPLGTLTPQARAALQGYSFDWEPTGTRNEGRLTVYDPRGQQLGRYLQTDASMTDTVRDFAGMLLQAGSFFAPGLMTGILQGAGLGTLGSHAVLGGLTSLVQGQDPLKGAVLGGLGSFAAPYVSDVARAAGEGVGGGALGGALERAVSGAGNAALRGGDVLTGAVSGGIGSLASSALDPLGLPRPAENIIARTLTGAALGRDPGQALANAALQEIWTGLRSPAAAPAPEGMPPNELARFLEANTTELQSDPLQSFDLGQMPPNELARFLEANVDEPSVVDQLLHEYYPTIFTSGNLEPDFYVAQRREGPVIEDSAGNRGEFVDGQWTVRSDPMQFSNFTPAPSSAPAARPTAAPAAPTTPQAPLTPSGSSGGMDAGALMAIMAAMGSAAQQQREPEPETAQIVTRSPFGNIFDT